MGMTYGQIAMGFSGEAEKTPNRQLASYERREYGIRQARARPQTRTLSAVVDRGMDWLAIGVILAAYSLAAVGGTRFAIEYVRENIHSAQMIQSHVSTSNSIDDLHFK
jgi:hypothetical protein